ncbi:hypothetical protein PC9H_007429 [Pleurotus ostreatus]|uniref:Protein kinase domain-containing protein n=1 Tax=Pleurotus ostreatus TaxID=5322 RepID=A0A8H7DU86_PLEOS|nr:uncharacterized protein PC9H_007429 [Pleurotus ostreatus]KAF7428208.1 hypothetical protein PC9H_007429 [Pleurotus ostreatus]KAJ8696294.1 hypothetical protein PTI98_006174 [Pleurotus ostreatus]
MSDSHLLSQTANLSTDVPAFSRGTKLEGRLSTLELFWRDHYDWLLEKGYQLRSRYRPDWKPSWEGTGKLRFNYSDNVHPTHGSVLDAERSSDGELLMLKRISKSLHPFEVEIGQLFSAKPLADNPQNHCVPIYEALQTPDDDNQYILVMPLLRSFDHPRFDTLGEAVEFFRQIFQGLQFMHQHHVAHRDATKLNVMMDARPLYPERYHPFMPWRTLDLSRHASHYTRTQKPVKYYLTDFGLSRRYKPEDRPPLEDIIEGGDKSVPEFSTSDACDPFPSDVYTIGNLVKTCFIEGVELDSVGQGFEFMKPLVADMTQEDPSKRPTMDEVVTRFEQIRKGLSPWKLRSRVVKKRDSYVDGVFHGIRHWRRRLVFMIQNVPPLPTP